MEYNIPGYELGERLGEGQYGVVFKAKHIELNQERAIKVLKESDKKTFIRYKREMKALSQINHPHIVQFYEYGRLDNKLPYFVMEYIEGKTLEDELKKHKYSPEKSVETILSLTSALQAMHKKGIIHRDIKPANILIDNLGKVYLTDFGLAKGKKDTGVTQTGQMLGTPKYMSPEQTLGEKEHIDHQTDIYSLGAVFYELLTGTVPHDGDNMFELLHNINEKEVISPSELNTRIPKDIEHICLKMLEKKKRLRYNNGADIEKDCKLFLDGEAIDKVYNVKEVLREFVRDYKEVVIGAVCGLGILVGGNVYLQYKNQELDGILQRQEKYKNKLEYELGLLEKGKEKNKQMEQAMKYIDILESGKIPKELKKTNGIKKLENDSTLVEEELQEYIQGLLMRNRGYQAPSYREYLDYMLKAGEHFLEAFQLSKNNLWYLSLGYECHYLNIHYHREGDVGVREINKYLHKDNKLIAPEENKNLLLFAFNEKSITDLSSGDEFHGHIEVVEREQTMKEINKLHKQLAIHQDYVAGYFILGSISGDLRGSGAYTNYFEPEATFNILYEGYLKYPTSPSLMNRIIYEYYEDIVKTYNTRYEMQFVSMIESALKINPYYINNLNRLMEIKKSQYLGYNDKKIIKEAVQIADKLNAMYEIYTEYFSDEEIIRMYYKNSRAIKSQLVGTGAMSRNLESMIGVYLHAKEYKKELETIQKIRKAHKNDALRTGNEKHRWAESSKETNKYYLRKAQLLEYFGRYEEAIDEYRLTRELYKNQLEESDKKHLYIKTMINSVEKRIERLKKKKK